jgi:hypothetical protein
MTWETNSTDEQRIRAGCAFLGIGAIILLFAWTMAVIRAPEFTQGEVAVRQEKLTPPEPNEILPTVGAAMLLCGLSLLAILILSIGAFLRISRKHRDNILRKPAKPTPTSDVWSMHKIPDIPKDQDDPNVP